MKFGIIVFPGSNFDRDMMHALRDDLQQEAIMLWHKDRDLSMFTKDDCIVLPGNFLAVVPHSEHTDSGTRLFSFFDNDLRNGLVRDM